MEGTIPHKVKVNNICYACSKSLYNVVNTANIINDKRLRTRMAALKERKIR